MKVYVTPRAEQNFDTIVNYITQNFGEKTAKEFIHKADEIFALLKEFPFMG